MTYTSFTLEFTNLYSKIKYILRNKKKSKTKMRYMSTETILKNIDLMIFLVF